MIKGEWAKCESGHCVEVLTLTSSVRVRNSMDPGGPWLTFTHEEWDAFIAAAKKGTFDL